MNRSKDGMNRFDEKMNRSKEKMDRFDERIIKQT